MEKRELANGTVIEPHRFKYLDEFNARIVVEIYA